MKPTNCKYVVGDLVFPKAYPDLCSKIKKVIFNRWTGGESYLLENDTLYDPEELE